MSNIDFNKYLLLEDGVCLYNCTPHPIRFQFPDREVTLDPCGATLPASVAETGFDDPMSVFDYAGIDFVKTKFAGTEQGYEEIKALSKHVRVILVASLISAQAYPASKGYPVVGMVIADPAWSRRAPSERVYSTQKFTVF